MLELKLISEASNPVTAVLKLITNLIGPVKVGSACPGAWFIDTVNGGGATYVTVLSVLVEAALSYPLTFPVATFALIEATTVPEPVIPVTVSV